MSKVTNGTKGVRNIERDAQIDFESARVVRMFDIDRESSERVIEEIGKGRRVWGLQALADQPSGNNGDEKPHNGEVKSGEISGWPLNPDMYGDYGLLVEENGNHENNGNVKPEGVVNGMDYRQMIPGAIPMVKIELPEQGTTDYLNIP